MDRARAPTGGLLHQADRGGLAAGADPRAPRNLAGAVRTGATFADGAALWLRYIKQDLERKPSMVTGYRWIVDSQLLPTFGSRPLEAITTEEVEARPASMHQASSSRIKALVLLHGIYQRAAKVWGLPFNPGLASSARSAPNR